MSSPDRFRSWRCLRRDGCGCHDELLTASSQRPRARGAPGGRRWADDIPIDASPVNFGRHRPRYGSPPRHGHRSPRPPPRPKARRPATALFPPASPHGGTTRIWRIGPASVRCARRGPWQLTVPPEPADQQVTRRHTPPHALLKPYAADAQRRTALPAAYRIGVLSATARPHRIRMSPGRPGVSALADPPGRRSDPPAIAAA